MPLRVLVVLLALSAAGVSAEPPAGTVRDESGSAVAGARIEVRTAQGSRVAAAVSAGDGSFTLPQLPAGSYVLTADAPALQARELLLDVGPAGPRPLEVVLRVRPLAAEVTVTAGRGGAEEIAAAAQVIAARSRADLDARPLPTLGSALEGSPGILVQQTSGGQVSPFLRGLTGYHVVDLVDGVRFNNATFRSGPNQYLAFIDPAQAARIEAMLGPAAAQYGSDALGGALHVLTPGIRPASGGTGGTTLHGSAHAFGASADASGGASFEAAVATPRFGLLAGAAGRRHNDVRAGRGEDSRHVFRRFAGLTPGEIRRLAGDRLQDSGFDQRGWHAKLVANPSTAHAFTLWHQQGDQGRSRIYKDLWGGQGRLRSDLAPQTLAFSYARYEKLGAGPFDSLSATFSRNVQRDGSLRQGLLASDPITRDESRAGAFGYAVQAAARWGARHALAFGSEVYDERVDSFRLETDPRTRAAVERRPLYPNGSRYTTWGLYARDAIDLVRERLRLVAGGRFTRVDFRTSAGRNRDASGASFGVPDARERFADLTFHPGAGWSFGERATVHVQIARAFRAPNLNDLGALGLNDLGYEVPARDAAGALLGSSDGEGATSLGRAVGALSSERLFHYELGLTLRHRRLYTRSAVFDAELRDPIVRRTLLYSADRLPAAIAGLSVVPIAPTEAQRAQDVRTVATPLDPRAVKAFVNEGRIRYYGFETLFRFDGASGWSAEGSYSYLAGRELDPNRHARRLPPQMASLGVRRRLGRGSWVALGTHLAGRQPRLSGGDLTDERIGAARRRRDVVDFFRGSLVQPFMSAGADGAAGTADDLFVPTGETVAAIRDRVLPLGAVVGGVRVADDTTRVPLYTATAGYAVFHVQAGIELAESLSLNGAVWNLLDRNYRVHGSGVDAPGVNAFVGLRYRF